MYEYQKKYFNTKTLDVDPSKQRVKVAIAEMSSIDRDGEVFDKKAFNRTIKENGPSGTNEIWHLLDHDKKSFSALGKFSEIFIEGDHLVGVSNYKNSFAWREVAWPLYESGDFTQHSVGFTPIKKVNQKDHTLITEVRLWEGSAVLWGANMNTPTVDVQKAMKDIFGEEDVIGISERFDMLIKSITNGKYNEENSSLVAIELMRLKQLTSNQTGVNPIDTEAAADGSELLQTIQTFTKNFIL